MDNVRVAAADKGRVHIVVCLLFFQLQYDVSGSYSIFAL